MEVHTYVWVITGVVMLAVLAFDIIMIFRRPHEPSMKECGIAIGFYVSMAVLFGLGVLVFSGARYATEFYAGWLTEYSLSVDNLFVFIIIMNTFRVPRQYQQSALLVGIIVAILMRGIFIAIGAAAINAWAWVFYIFGFFLVYTAIQLVRQGGQEEDEDYENIVIRTAKKVLPVTDDYHGVKLFIKENGKRFVTPMLIVMIALASADLLFAVDSIPAIFGLTKETYLVFTANVFALMGLRQLYFLLGGLVKRLVYLSYGLAVILAFIGAKLLLHALHENEVPFINGGEHVKVPEIGIEVSLGVIIGVLGITAIASLLRTRVVDRAAAANGESGDGSGAQEPAETEPEENRHSR